MEVTLVDFDCGVIFAQGLIHQHYGLVDLLTVEEELAALHCDLEGDELLKEHGQHAHGRS